MTVNGTEDLMMTGRRLLQLARSLHRMTRLDGALGSYQDMLVNPLCRLNSILDALAPSSPHGTQRTVSPLAWHPPDARDARDTSPRPSSLSDAPSPPSVTSRHGTFVAQGAHAPLAHSGPEAPAVTNVAAPQLIAPWPEAYLMSRQMGRQRSADEGRATLPMAPEIMPGIAPGGTVSTGDSTRRPPSTFWRESALTPTAQTNMAPDEAREARLRLFSDAAALRHATGFVPASLMGHGRDGVEQPEAGDRRYMSPAPPHLHPAAPPTAPEPGSVRLSRGGASLVSILRHNLAPGQSSLAQRATGLFPGSTSGPEGNRQAGARPGERPYDAGNDQQVILEHRVGPGGPLPHQDASAAWGSDAPGQLSPEQIEQILDTLAEQLEISLLRTYGTTRR
jgi:hypothetical protein